MEQDYYTAKEAMEVLNMPNTTFYREVNAGNIPYEIEPGRRRGKRFPRAAIDALAEVEAGNHEIEGLNLSFTPSTIADAWNKQQITQQAYGIEDAVPFKTVLAWRKRNDKISMNVKEGDKLVGWVTFLPLDEKVILDLINGYIKERDIPLKAIRKWTDKQLSVYIPVLEAIPSGEVQRDRTVGAFLIKNTVEWALTLMMRYDIKNWYAIGLTSEGQALLESLGFRLLTSLEDGKRKGYVLERGKEPTKLLRRFLEKLA